MCAVQQDSQRACVDALRKFLGLPTSGLLAIVVWGLAMLIPALRPFPQWLILAAASALVGRGAVWVAQEWKTAIRRNRTYKQQIDSMSPGERGIIAAALNHGTSQFLAAQLDPAAQLLAYKQLATMVGPKPDWDSFIWEIDSRLWEWLRQHPDYINRAN